MKSSNSLLQRGLVATAVGAALLGTTVIAGGPASAAPVPSLTGFAATAFGSQVSAAGGRITSGPTGLSFIGCTTAVTTRSNATAAVDLGAVGHIGAVHSSIRTTRSGTVSTNTSSASIADVSLLGGRIKANTVGATTMVRADGSTLSGTGSSSRPGLIVLGNSITVGTTKNYRVDLPGIGYVVFNEQGSTQDANRIYYHTLAIDVHITVAGNPTGLGLGTTIALGYATASIAPNVPGLLSGLAYGTTVKVGTVVKSGPTALVGDHCTGGSEYNSIATLGKVPGVTAGAVASSAVGSVGAGVLDLRNTNTITKVNVLGGLVTADTVKASVHIHGVSGASAYEVDTKDSTLGGVSILGVPRDVSTLHWNTVVSVPGAKITFFQHSATANSAKMTMIVVELLAPNAGLPAGTVITVSTATGKIVL